jgi:hypothetical protein
MCEQESEEAPGDILFPCAAMDVAFHPSRDILAVGLVTGAVEVCVLPISVSVHVNTPPPPHPPTPLNHLNPPPHQALNARPLVVFPLTRVVLALGSAGVCAGPLRFTYNHELCTKALRIPAHTDSCRVLEFSPGAECTQPPFAALCSLHGPLSLD